MAKKKKNKKYALGGKMNGPSHKDGGIPIEVEGGEYVIKKDSVNPQTEKTLEHINKTGTLPQYDAGGRVQVKGGADMPVVKEKSTGKVVSRQPYNQKGINNASTIAQSNPNWEVEHDASNAMDRSTTMYPGGGKTGYNVPMYEEGGSTEKEKEKKLDFYTNKEDREALYEHFDMLPYNKQNVIKDAVNKSMEAMVAGTKIGKKKLKKAKKKKK
tara:strand:- start:171 stop:809 length:639 start_codon:yes stop_codon:yes gene_type:complete